MNIENQNTQPATRETMPEYLDRLAADQLESGMLSTADDTKAAAAEIRKLTRKVDQLAAGMAEVASREDQLASALFSLIEDRVQTFVENEVQTAIDDYDPTEHYNFSDAVAEQTADTSTESIREAVADVMRNGHFDVTFSS